MKKTKLRDIARCGECYDEHICPDCGGTGYLDPEETEECKQCGGSGKCPWCPEDDDGPVGC